jgi:hypothetical protein
LKDGLRYSITVTSSLTAALVKDASVSRFIYSANQI